ncbi:sensor histidine kinase, partial [Cellulomonas sp. HZM]|uniref:sensor histidine kinase n=1 Tax=Cellulomonas sp. HZM TaxID=1454010 RepID=UPI0004938CBF
MNTWERLLAWGEQHRFAVDACGTLALLALVVPTTASFNDALIYDSTRSGALLAVLLVTPLAWRRVAPTLSAVAVYTVALCQIVFVTPLALPADFAVLAALYSVTVHGPRWAHRVAMASSLVGAVALGLAVDPRRSLPGATAAAVFVATFSLAVWAFGLVRRARRETVEALVDRAQRLEVERDQQAQLATAAERARIAREMHDIVAHSLSVVIAQADGGRYAAASDPAAAQRALATIAETGRAALTDMRRLLGVLRDEPGEARSSSAAGTVVPQPAEGDLDALVEQVRASGTQVSLVRMGAPRALPPGVGLTVYRIAQESLTNVLKHAGPDPQVTLMVQWQSESIALEITDDGRGAAAEGDGQGHGLRGMRERASMFGGTLSAGPRPGGGFRVRALLPTTGGVTSAAAQPQEQETA